MAETISGTHGTFPCGDGQAEWAWINTGMVDPPKVVTNPSINWARRSLTLLMWRMLLPLRQTSHMCQTKCNLRHDQQASLCCFVATWLDFQHQLQPARLWSSRSIRHSTDVHAVSSWSSAWSVGGFSCAQNNHNPQLICGLLPAGELPFRSDTMVHADYTSTMTTNDYRLLRQKAATGETMRLNIHIYRLKTVKIHGFT